MTPPMSTPPGAAPAQPAAPTKTAVRLLTVWHAVRRHPVVVLLVLLFAGAAGSAAWFLLPLPKMTGVAAFKMSSQPPAVLNAIAENRVEFTTYKTMQAALVKQRMVLNQALNNLETRDQGMLGREADKVAFLERNLQVDFKLGPEMMRVTLEGNDAGELEAILKAVSTAYLAEVYKNEYGARDNRRKQLEIMKTRYEGVIQSYQKSLSSVAITLQSVNPAILAMIDQVAQFQLQMIQRDIAQARVDLGAAVGEAELYQKKAEDARKREVTDAELDRAARADQAVLAREHDVAARKAAFEDLDKAILDKSLPKLVQAKKAWADAGKDLEQFKLDSRTRLTEAVRQREVDDANLLAKNATERAEKLARLLKDREDQFKKFQEETAAKTREYMELEQFRRDLARNEKLHEQIVHEIDLMDMEKGAPLRVTGEERPYVMTGVEGNRRLKTALMAGGAALLLGLVGLVFWEVRYRRVLAVDDVGKDLGLRVYGTVPPHASEVEKSKGALAVLTEAIDTTRTMLLYGAPGGRPPKTVLVTSALPGEGKTTLSGHLAVSLTRAGYRTLLIDADMRNPTGHAVFGLPAGPGLSEVLRGEAALAGAIQPTPFPGLSLLPGGQWSVGATQGLAGEPWAAVRAAAEAEYDFVVVDSAPVLPVVDTLLLARHVGGVILSVLCEHSRVATVAETQHRLESIGAPLLGAVLNGVHAQGGGYGYGYGYGYPYPYGKPARAGDIVVTTPA